MIITITIMGILLLLAVVNVNSSQVRARDDERRTDIASIGLALESFYNSGMSSPSVSSITNIVRDPRGVNTTDGLFVTFGGMVRTTGVSWAGIDNWYRYRWVNTANNNLSRHNLDLSQLTNGQQYTISFLAGNDGVSSIDATTDFADTTVQSFSLEPGEIKRIHYTASRPTYDSTFRFVDLNVGTGTSGMLISNLMVTAGNTIFTFADGDSPSWSWSGAVNNSVSSGPSVSITPGSYPDMTIITGGLLEQFLPDIDPKAFTTPSSQSPAESFIAAVNAVQTAAGVSPQPTVGQYVYQPIDSNGRLCHTRDCRKFNLYYRLEGDNTVYKVTSKNQ